MMQFSIVIPLFNKSEFIEAAVRSVLGQSCRNLEIVIVDDGSTDSGVDVVESLLSCGNIKLLRQCNKGVAVARNTGIVHSTGRIICFLDADDYWEPGFLREINNLFDEFPTADFAGTSYFRFRSRQEKIAHYPVGGKVESNSRVLIDDFYAKWRRSPFVFTSSIAVRRTALRDLGEPFQSGVSESEDQDLWFRLSESSPFAYSRMSLVGYRSHVDGSLSSVNPTSTLFAYRQLQSRLLAKQIPPVLIPSAQRLLDKHQLDLVIENATIGRKCNAVRRFKQIVNRLSALQIAKSIFALLSPAILIRLVRRWYGVMVILLKEKMFSNTQDNHS